jgi:hypothetical protein
MAPNNRYAASITARFFKQIIAAGYFHKFYARPAVGTAAAPTEIREHQDKIEKKSTRGVWGVALPML